MLENTKQTWSVKSLQNNGLKPIRYILIITKTPNEQVHL